MGGSANPVLSRRVVVMLKEIAYAHVVDGVSKDGEDVGRSKLAAPLNVSVAVDGRRSPSSQVVDTMVENGSADVGNEEMDESDSGESVIDVNVPSTSNGLGRRRVCFRRKVHVDVHSYELARRNKTPGVYVGPKIGETTQDLRKPELEKYKEPGRVSSVQVNDLIDDFKKQDGFQLKTKDIPDFSAPSPHQRGCGAECGESGCADDCYCKLNDLFCLRKNGCKCTFTNCRNRKIPRNPAIATEKVASANMELGEMSMIDMSTIKSVTSSEIIRRRVSFDMNETMCSVIAGESSEALAGMEDQNEASTSAAGFEMDEDADESDEYFDAKDTFDQKEDDVTLVEQMECSAKVADEEHVDDSDRDVLVEKEMAKALAQGVQARTLDASCSDMIAKEGNDDLESVNVDTSNIAGNEVATDQNKDVSKCLNELIDHVAEQDEKAEVGKENESIDNEHESQIMDEASSSPSSVKNDDDKNEKESDEETKETNENSSETPSAVVENNEFVMGASKGKKDGNKTTGKAPIRDIVDISTSNHQAAKIPNEQAELDQNQVDVNIDRNQPSTSRSVSKKRSTDQLEYDSKRKKMEHQKYDERTMESFRLRQEHQNALDAPLVEGEGNESWDEDETHDLESTRSEFSDFEELGIQDGGDDQDLNNMEESQDAEDAGENMEDDDIDGSESPDIERNLEGNEQDVIDIESGMDQEEIAKIVEELVEEIANGEVAAALDNDNIDRPDENAVEDLEREAEAELIDVGRIDNVMEDHNLDQGVEENGEDVQMNENEFDDVNGRIANNGNAINNLNDEQDEDDAQIDMQRDDEENDMIVGNVDDDNENDGNNNVIMVLRRSTRYKRKIVRFGYDQDWIPKRRRYSNAVPNPTPQVRRPRAAPVPPAPAIHVPRNLPFSARLQPILPTPPPPPQVPVIAPIGDLSMLKDEIVALEAQLEQYDYGVSKLDMILKLRRIKTTVSRLEKMVQVDDGDLEKLGKAIAKVANML